MVRSELRLSSVDYAKALAIVAVIVTHSGLPFWAPTWTPTDRLVSAILPSFHVPTFIAIAGFLYARSQPMTTAELLARLQRLLPAYVVASILATILGLANASTLTEFLIQLATGSGFGIYYFVFVLTACTVIGWGLSQWRPLLYVAFGLSLLQGIATTLQPSLSPPESFAWEMRNPVHMLGYFLGGWIARLHWASVSAILTKHGWGILTGGIGLVALYITRRLADPPIAELGLLRALYTIGVLAVAFELTENSEPPAIVRYLSMNSYTLFLYHNFFQIALRPYTGDLQPLVRIAVLAVAGLTGGLIVCAVGRRVFGRHARLVLGAQ
jgi:fucose 4-O-acetylase-like acetyltransferase